MLCAIRWHCVGLRPDLLFESGQCSGRARVVGDVPVRLLEAGLARRPRSPRGFVRIRLEVPGDRVEGDRDRGLRRAAAVVCDDRDCESRDGERGEGEQPEGRDPTRVHP